MDSRLRGNDGYGVVALVSLPALVGRARPPPEGGFAKIGESLGGLARAYRFDIATNWLCAARLNRGLSCYWLAGDDSGMPPASAGVFRPTLATGNELRERGYTWQMKPACAALPSLSMRTTPRLALQEVFLRNNRLSGILFLQDEPECFRASAQIVQDTLPVALFIIARPGISV